jgi:hypothetical protein
MSPGHEIWSLREAGIIGAATRLAGLLAAGEHGSKPDG